MATNIDYWEKVLEAPTPEYEEFFKAEHNYLQEKIPANSKVLDIGCGEGRNMKSISVVTTDVHGIDSDETAVAHTIKNFENLPSVTATVCDATSLPFEDKTFDVVTHLMTLSNLGTGKEKSLQEVSRVLKDGGRIILSSFSDSAFEERMKIYEKINVPIKRIEGTTVVFDDSVGANTSEQFSEEDIKQLAEASGLEVVEYKKVGALCFLALLQKRS